MKNTEKTMDKIVALCKNRGIIFAGSEIYGGLANTWDYGPLGVELKNNIKRAWWKKFIQENPYNVGQDAAILEYYACGDFDRAYFEQGLYALFIYPMAQVYAALIKKDFNKIR